MYFHGATLAKKKRPPGPLPSQHYCGLLAECISNANEGGQLIVLGLLLPPITDLPQDAPMIDLGREPVDGIMSDLSSLGDDTKGVGSQKNPGHVGLTLEEPLDLTPQLIHR